MRLILRTRIMAAPTPPRPLVLVGCGQIVTHHCAALAALPSGTFQIVALVDPSADRRRVISKQLLDTAPHLLQWTSEGEKVPVLAECNALDDFLSAEDNIIKQQPAILTTNSKLLFCNKVSKRQAAAGG